MNILLNYVLYVSIIIITALLTHFTTSHYSQIKARITRYTSRKNTQPTLNDDEVIRVLLKLNRMETKVDELQGHIDNLTKRLITKDKNTKQFISQRIDEKLKEILND